MIRHGDSQNDGGGLDRGQTHMGGQTGDGADSDADGNVDSKCSGDGKIHGDDGFVGDAKGACGSCAKDTA